MRLAFRSGLVALALTTHVHAQTPDAETLYREGVALRRQRHDAEALAEFRRAYSIQPAPRTLAQIALAEQALGRWVDAEADLQRAVQTKDDAWIERNRDVLAAGLTDIRRHLGDLDVEADAPGAELWVNGARVAVLPLAHSLRVETGSVLLEVRARGYASARRTTFVEPGERAHEDIHLVPLVLQAPVAVDQAARAPLGAEEAARAPGPVDRPMRAASFVLLGAGVAGVAAGTYFGVRTLVAKSNSDALCSHVCTDPRGIRFDQDSRFFAPRSTAWLVAGIGVASAGGVLFWMSRARNLPDRTAAVHLSFDVGPSNARAALGGFW
ncbi:MAG TPA: tetratricopeptide repeat protein [Polyangiaceae bacterium]|nr:tetratricopeptide repeat protein [Polyangiaceae bacterium]